MQTNQFKFITLNLYEGGLFFEQVIEFIKTENPDIIVFQEVNNGQDTDLPKQLRSMQILSQNFPEYFSFFAPEMLMRYKEGKVDIGNAIFSLYPISQTKTIFLNTPYGEYDPVPVGGDFSKHPKNMQSCQIQINNIPIHVCNLHGIWELSGADTPERLKMSQIIVDEVKSVPHTILAGDFNLKPNTQTIANIEKHLISVFKDKLTTSFNLKHKDLKRFPGYATAVVDMVFTSSDFDIVNTQAAIADVSDHLPLICTLATKQN